MITIEQFQEVAGNPELKTVSPTGEYEETALIECASIEDLSQPLYMFQAQRVAFGDIVYQQDETLSEAQVAELLSGEPSENVIGNEELIEAEAPRNPQVSKVKTAQPPQPETPAPSETPSESQSTEAESFPEMEESSIQTQSEEGVTPSTEESPVAAVSRIKRSRVAVLRKRKIS